MVKKCDFQETFMASLDLCKLDIFPQLGCLRTFSVMFGRVHGNPVPESMGKDTKVRLLPIIKFKL